MNIHDSGSRNPERETVRPPLTSTAAIIPFKLYVFGLAALWTSVIGVLFWVSINTDREERLDVVRAQARGHFDMYMVYMQPAYMSGYTADVIAPLGVLEERVYFIQKLFELQYAVEYLMRAGRTQAHEE